MGKGMILYYVFDVNREERPLLSHFETGTGLSSNNYLSIFDQIIH